MEEALAIADGSADEQRIVNTVLAFQRWRNLQLKKRFGQELKNVLKEAHQDEACFSAMEMELEKKDKLLSRAMADSAHLRAQLFALEEANAEPKVQFHHQQVLKVAQKATIVEEEVQRRDNEIRRLQQQIRFLEDEAHRTNGTKHADISLLQRDKNSALIENKILLEQLARKDQEAIRLTKERENLQDKFSSLCESQITHESQIDILNEDNKAKMQSLQRKIEREQIAKKNIEIQLLSFKKRFESLRGDKKKLVAELQRVTKQTYATSTKFDDCTASVCERNWSTWALIHTRRRNRLSVSQLEWLVFCSTNARLARRLPTITSALQELLEKLHDVFQRRADSYEGVATKMVNYLKKLIDEVKNLKAVHKNSLLFKLPKVLKDIVQSMQAQTDGRHLSRINEVAVSKSLQTRMANSLKNRNFSISDLLSENELGDEVSLLNKQHRSELNIPDDSTQLLEIWKKVCTKVPLNGKDIFKSPVKKSKFRTFNHLQKKSSLLSETAKNANIMNFVNWIVWNRRWKMASLNKRLFQKKRRSLNSLKRTQNFCKNVSERPLTPESRVFSQKRKDFCVLSPSKSVEDEVKKWLSSKKLLPIVFSFWQAFNLIPNLERKALLHCVNWDQIIAVLPWWIERLKLRRKHKKILTHWRHCTLLSNNKKLELDSYLAHSYDSDHSSVTLPYDFISSCTDKNFNNVQLHNHCSLKEAAVIVANANQSLRTQSENAADDAVTADNSTRYKKGTTQRHSSAKDVTFMDRALGALQVSLHQELQDVQALLLKYFSVLQQQVAGQKGDVVKALLEMKESNQERLLSLFWEVCNNLAAALVGAREQLTSIVGECQPHCRISQPVPERQVSHALERKTHEKIYCTQPSYVNEDRFELCTTQDHRAEICHVDISGDSSLRAGSIKKSDTHFNVAFLKKHKDEGPQPSRRRKCFAAQYASLLQSEIGRLGGNKGNKTGDTQDTDYFKKVCVQKG